MRDPRCRCKIRRAMASVNRVWIETSDNVICDMYSPLTPLEREYMNSILGSNTSGSGVRRKIPAARYVHVLAHLMGMVLLLDSYATNGLPSWAPPLFVDVPGGSFASSNVVNDAISAFLGEVDAIRYLKILGIEVSYVQPLCVLIPMTVENLAIDLRDGIKLCKLASQLKDNPAIFSSKAIYPAERRVDRLSNIQSALTALSIVDEDGICARVADGDKEATMSLLWECFFRFELPSLLNLKSIDVEICHIGRKVGAHEVILSDEVNCMSLGTRLTLKEIPALRAVMSWLHIVASSQYIELKDVFRNPEDRINALEAILCHYTGVGLGMKTAVVFERLQFMLNEVGGLPKILTIDEMMDSVDCRPLMVYFATICKRVLSVHHEHRAAIVIQRHWRSICSRDPDHARKTLKRWKEASLIIQKSLRVYLFRKNVRESHIIRENMCSGAVHLQSLWRAYSSRRRYLDIKKSCLIIQCQWRMYLQKKLLSETLHTKRVEEGAAICVQTAWRGHAARRIFLAQRQSAVTIQSCWRGDIQRRKFVSARTSAVVIQSQVRSILARKHIYTLQSSTVRIQSHYRAYVQRSKFLEMQKVAILIQSQFRAQQAIKKTRQKMHAIVLIQQAFRRCLQERRAKHVLLLQQEMLHLESIMHRYVHRQAAAWRIQNAWKQVCHQRKKAEMARERANIEWQAALLIQTWMRSHIQRKLFLKQRKSALIIQTSWITYLQTQNALKKLLSSYARAHEVCLFKEKSRQAACTIQKVARMYLVCNFHSVGKHLSSLRARLVRASYEAQQLLDMHAFNPFALGNMTVSALQSLKKKSSDSLKSLEKLQYCTGCSNACCDILIRHNGISILLARIFSVVREPSQQRVVSTAFCCIKNILHADRFLRDVAEDVLSNGLMEKLADLVFQQRDCMVRNISSKSVFHRVAQNSMLSCRSNIFPAVGGL